MAVCEQSLFDQILVGPRSERGGTILLVFRKCLAQLSHRAVEMTQVQIIVIKAFDGVVVFPFFCGAVAAGREKAMQYGEEDGPLDGTFEASAFKQDRQDIVDRAGLPESLED